MTNTKRKVDLYVLSLALLFVFIFIITIKFPDGQIEINNLAAWEKFFEPNILSTVVFGLFLYSIYAYKRFDFDLNGAPDLPFEVTKVESINYEHLTFLATYVIPLISFEFSSPRQMIVLCLLLMVMCVIYIKTDLFYANPSLALLGFQINRADAAFKNGQKEGIILISKEKIQINQKLNYIKLDDRIYYVKRVD